MSRIIVKGLPKYLTEDRLREHFAKKGEVTDVKLRKNRIGESRRFCFIGFKNLTDAENAVKYFNDSFIDTARIQVELAKSFADPDVPKSFKQKKWDALAKVKEREERDRLREEREREYKRQKVAGKKSRIDEDIANDPKLKEFIESTKPSSQTKSWSNDVVINDEETPSNKLLDQALQLKQTGNTGGVEEKFNNKIADEIFREEEKESDDEYDNLTSKDQDDAKEEEMISLNDIPKEEDGAAKDENISDLEWLKKRRVRIKDNAGDTAEETSAEDTEVKLTRSEPQAEPEVSDEEKAISKIRETGRLFIRNISYDAKEEDFRHLFSEFGVLEEIHIAVDTRNGTSKGFAYVKFSNSEDAIQAYINLDKQIFQGRLLHILPSEAKKDHRLDEFDLKNLPLKKQRELKKKADASKATFSWNSLYMNNDAILNSISAQLGISKTDLINPENSNSAVKQALAEAHVIGDVRKFFESKNIDLTKFQGKERDDSIILVKNFPYGTTESEIVELFQPFGDLKRVIMPPSGTIAIVQFRDLPSGRAAFTKLSYRRFKKSIIYLEKGPKDLFTKESEDPIIDKVEETNVKEVESKFENIIEEENEDNFEGISSSIFIKNLNFNTTTTSLSNLFKGFDGFLLATIKTKPDSKDSSKKLSMGFGFAEFKTKEQAERAIKTLDSTVLDGHKLQLKLSHRQNVIGSNAKSKAKNASGKIIVKNLPFEATRKDVFELFNSFGELKSVRVPKKFDKSARGFAFVEFVLPKEAESAMNQLEGVHLLGRRLVLQNAEQESEDVEQEIDKMTQKVKKQVNTQKLGALRLTGKRKLELDNDDDE